MNFVVVLFMVVVFVLSMRFGSDGMYVMKVLTVSYTSAAYTVEYKNVVFINSM